MSKSNIIELEGRERSADPLTELLTTSTRQLIHQAVLAEAQEVLASYEDRHLADGRASVVLNVNSSNILISFSTDLVCAPTVSPCPTWTAKYIVFPRMTIWLIRCDVLIPAMSIQKFRLWSMVQS